MRRVDTINGHGHPLELGSLQETFILAIFPEKLGKQAVIMSQYPERLFMSDYRLSFDILASEKDPVPWPVHNARHGRRCTRSAPLQAVIDHHLGMAAFFVVSFTISRNVTISTFWDQDAMKNFSDARAQASLHNLRQRM